MDPPLRGRWDLKGDREMEALRERAAAAQRSVRRLMERQQGSSKHYRAHCSQRRNTNSQTGKKSEAVSGFAARLAHFWLTKSFSQMLQEFSEQGGHGTAQCVGDWLMCWSAPMTERFPLARVSGFFKVRLLSRRADFFFLAGGREDHSPVVASICSRH